MSDEKINELKALKESNIYFNKAFDKPYQKKEISYENKIFQDSFNKQYRVKKIQSSMDFYLKVSVLGILRGAIGLIWEHPLDSIKTQWQTNAHIRKSRDIVNHIYKEKGFVGFYRGFFPNLIRQTSKNVYRWPLMLYLPKVFNKMNNSLARSLNTDGLCKIQTGLAIANIETLLINPLERLKIFLMTHKNVSNKYYSILIHFYKNNEGRFMKQLFQGLEASLYRSNISWVTFLYLDYKGKHIIKSYSQKDQLNFSELILISFFVGLGNLCFSKIFVRL